MTKNRELLFKLIITSILTALCFALTYVSVPLPTGAKVHLGNFVCVLSALLLGGIPGGIVGSLGMGLNDIASGYTWDTYVRTFIVKFILGFMVGFLYRVLVKKEKASTIILYSLTGLFVVGFIVTLVLYCNGTYAGDGISKYIIHINNAKKTLSLSILVPIGLAIISAILIGLIITILVLKKNNKESIGIYNCVAVITTISVLINTALEFVLRWIIKGTIVGYSQALVESIAKLPSNLLTGIVTIFFVTIIYVPIYKAVSKRGYAKYLINVENNIE